QPGLPCKASAKTMFSRSILSPWSVVPPSVGERPADQRHSENQHKHSGADQAQRSSVAEQVVARFRVDAQDDGYNQDHAPSQHRRQALIPANHGEKLTGRLPRGNPPGDHWRHASGQREGEQFSRQPAFYLGPRFLPNEIVPREQARRQRHPTIYGGVLVNPIPAAKQKPPVTGLREPGQRE